MHPFFQRPGVRRFRVAFRWFRIFLWLVLFLALAAVAYLHLVGLPDFVKQPMLRRLQAEDVSAQFSNMQLGWGRGPLIIIENASFSRLHQPLSPRLTAGRGELAVDWDALRHFQLAVRSLEVADAQLQFPVSQTNGELLLLTNVSLDVRFRSNDVMRVNFFRGTFRGMQTDLIGEVTHASELRHWKLPIGGGQTGATNAALQTRLQRLAQTLKKIHFTGKPTLRIEAAADGRDKNSFHAEANFDVPAVNTPWGAATNLSIDAACARLVDSGHQSLFQIGLTSSGMATPWAKSGKTFFLTTVSRAANSNLAAEIEYDAADFKSSGEHSVGAAQFSWSGSATLASSNLFPEAFEGKLHAVSAETPLGSARDLLLEGRAVHVPDPPAPDASLGQWAKFLPWQLEWQTELRNVAIPKLLVDHVSFSGHWKNAQIALENLKGDLYGGHVSAGATLDVVSRELKAGGVSQLDPHSVSQLFDQSVSNWLTQLDWAAAPTANVQVRVVLPPWTNRPANWQKDADDSLQITGDFTVGAASFHPVPVVSASGHVAYTNRVWHVSRLHAVRPEGDVDLDYTSGPRTFHYLIDSRMDPKAAMPLVAPQQPDVLDDFTFKQPPSVHAEIWGGWSPDEVTGVVISAGATDFVARGEPVASFRADAVYTNNVLTVRNLEGSNTVCRVHAPWGQINLATKEVILTNAAGNIDPRLLQRVLGTNSPDFLKAIHFDTLPSVSVSGTFSLTNALAADLRFLVSGDGLHFTNLMADHVSGEIDWAGRTVTLTNILGTLYKNGALAGWVEFISQPDSATLFHAKVSVKDIDLPSLAAGMAGAPNHLEGLLDGELDLTGPNDSDHSFLEGRGRVHVYDALLWDIKIFGIFSPVLNLFSPGWGHSRAREASATFAVAAGAVSSDDLVVRSTGFVLKLRGTVNRKKEINARMEAVLSKEVPLLGPLISMAFTPFSKLFEYHISGPLGEPVLEPLYVPRFISFLLHPFKGSKPSPTPAPAPPPVPAETK